MISEYIICAGAPNIAIEELQAHVEQAKNPYIVGVDGGALQLAGLSIEMDIALGDFDSVKNMEPIMQYADRIERYPSEKDDTDLELALHLVQMLSNKHQTVPVTIYGGIGNASGRIDHLICNIWLAFQPRFQSLVPSLQFVEKTTMIRFMTAGEHTLVNESNARYLSLISMTPIDNLTIQGAKYNVQNRKLMYPTALISNEFVNDSAVTVSFSNGIIMVLWEQSDQTNEV